VTFGISIIIQNVLFEIFSADSQRLLSGELDTLSLKLSDTLSIGWLPLIAFLASIAVITSLQFFFYKTKTGMVFRATSDNSEVVELMGVNRNHVFALAMGVALAVAALAAIFMGMRTNFDPSVGPARLIYAFEAVIIGGLGSLWGTLAGGIIIGVSQAIGANINPGWQVLSGHLVFLFILAIKPNGLFPKTKD
jgi:branched-chain amino acid transport system permease protein